MLFAKLDDSPALRKQLVDLEEGAEGLRQRCMDLVAFCSDYTVFISDVIEADIALVQTLEDFCGTHEDPVSVAIGGPVMAPFLAAMREVATFKETLCSQMEHLMGERISQFCNSDLLNLKEVRRRFDRAARQYDQARKRALAVPRSAPAHVVEEEEENLQNARMHAEQARFNLITALSNVESRKKYLFLESVGSMMDAQLRCFKQSYQHLSNLEPYIHQVLAFAHKAQEQASQELSDLAERMYQYRRQWEGQSGSASSSSSASGPSTPGFSSGSGGDATPVTPGSGAATPSGCSPTRVVATMGEAGTAAAASPAVGRGPEWPLPRPSGELGSSPVPSTAVSQMVTESAGHKVRVIKEGYLGKHGGNSAGAHGGSSERLFFVLDSRGVLYHHRPQPAGGSAGGTSSPFSLFSLMRGQRPSATAASAEPSSGSPFSHFVFSDDDASDFSTLLGRSPESSLSPQHARRPAAEDLNKLPRNLPPGSHESINLLTAMVKMDAEDATLRFCFRIVSPERTFTLQAESEAERKEWVESIMSVILSLLSFQPTPRMDSRHHTAGGRRMALARTPSAILTASLSWPVSELRLAEGNNACADCGAPDPEWASLNLGVLICIECSGVHRKLGSHISKVRSLCLDVRVWTPSLVGLLSDVGNAFANSVWEAVGAPPARSTTTLEAAELGRDPGLLKPRPEDSFFIRERFVTAKYVERQFADQCGKRLGGPAAVTELLRTAVAAGDVRTALRLIVAADADVNWLLPPQGRAAPASPKPPYAGPTAGAGGIDSVPPGNIGDADISAAMPTAQHSAAGNSAASGKPTSPEEQAPDREVRASPRLRPLSGGSVRLRRGWNNQRLANVPGEAAPTPAPGMPSGTFLSPQEALGPHTTRLLHVACAYGHDHVVELLLLWGASPYALDGSRRSAYEVAVAVGSEPCAALLASR